MSKGNSECSSVFLLFLFCGSYFLLDLFLCISFSHSEPNIATAAWRRSRRKVITEQRTASSRLLFFLFEVNSRFTFFFFLMKLVQGLLFYGHDSYFKFCLTYAMKLFISFPILDEIIPTKFTLDQIIFLIFTVNLLK